MEHAVANTYPVIGTWFRRPNGVLFEVVAADEDDATIEIQHFDGTIDEVDFDAWPGLLLLEVNAPEDFSGSLDMDPEDYAGRSSSDMPPGFHDPFEFLDKPG